MVARGFSVLWNPLPLAYCTIFLLISYKYLFPFLLQTKPRKIYSELCHSRTMLSTKRTKTSLKITFTISSSHHEQQTSSSSAETIANNDDLLSEILVCLPIKSLLIFKSVSKHWLSLISNPNFSLRLNLIPRTPSGLFFYRSLSALDNPEYDFINLNSNPYRPPFKSLTFVDDPSGINILQSCKGLLLCRSFRGWGPNRNYYIFNPTTKHYTILPQLRVNRGVFRSIFGVNLAFDPSKSPHYKVICVRNCDSSSDGYCQIEIYSPKTGPWRLSGGPFPAPDNINFSNGVFWNGAIHWISPYGNCLYFHVDKEKLQDMPMPPIPDGWDERRFSYLGESGGHLHLIENYGPCATVFNVHEMERDYSTWFVKYRVDLAGVATVFPEMVRSYLDPGDLNYYAFSVLSVVREENDEDSYLVVHLPEKAIRYNFKDKTLKKLHDFDTSDFDGGASGFGWFDAFQHIESLACV